MGTEPERTATLGGDRSELPEVAIIVLNWNNYEDTAECLASLEELNYPNYRVIVVDNGSTDESGKNLEKEFKWCDFVFNGENLGFAAGNNVAIRRALEDDVDYVLLLNNDVVVKPNTLSLLERAAECTQKVGIVGPKIVKKASGLIESAGRTYKSFENPHFGKSKGEVSGVGQVGGVIGACMLISTELINEIGVLDEDFFFQGEDREYCLRAQANGWRVFVQADATVRHDSHSSSSSFFRKYHVIKAHKLVRIKGEQFDSYSLLFDILSDIKYLVGHIIRRDFEEMNAIILAYYDLSIGDHRNPRLELLEEDPRQDN